MEREPGKSRKLSDKDQLKIRVKEQVTLTNLSALRMNTFNEQLNRVTDIETSKVLLEAMQTTAASTKSVTDSQWVQALIRVRIPPKDILQVWEKKDELSRKDTLINQ